LRKKPYIWVVRLPRYQRILIDSTVLVGLFLVSGAVGPAVSGPAWGYMAPIAVLGAVCGMGVGISGHRIRRNLDAQDAKAGTPDTEPPETVPNGHEAAAMKWYVCRRVAGIGGAVALIALITVTTMTQSSYMHVFLTWLVYVALSEAYVAEVRGGTG
jgi:hypothetical protein